MSELKIEIGEDRLAFEPGEEISGKVSWNFEKTPHILELRLFWFTRGKGTEDAGIAGTSKFEQPQASESRTFRHQLPNAPYSFSGKLISLVWALELIAYPSKETTRREFVVAPGGQEVQLECVPQQAFKGTGFSVTIR
jgi:hypothetical protein